MQVNMLEAKNQLSKLVKAAVQGEDIVIASEGKPLVKLVPVAKDGLGGWGRLRKYAANIDMAFEPEVDAQVARMIGD